MARPHPVSLPQSPTASPEMLGLAYSRYRLTLVLPIQLRSMVPVFLHRPLVETLATSCSPMALLGAVLHYPSTAPPPLFVLWLSMPLLVVSLPMEPLFAVSELASELPFPMVLSFLLDFLHEPGHSFLVKRLT